MDKASDHDHKEYATRSNIICSDCNKYWEVCAFCNYSWHDCEAKKTDNKIQRGYKVIPEFPDYMVNNQATVRHILTGRYCMLVRVSKQGGAMINVRKDGKIYTRAAQDLRKQAFNGDSPS